PPRARGTRAEAARCPRAACPSTWHRTPRREEAAVARCARSSALWSGRKHHRWARALAEVEIGDEIPETGVVLPDVGPGVGPAVGAWVEPGAAEEIVLDELEVGVERERLVVDESAPGVWRDDETRDPDPEA